MANGRNLTAANAVVILGVTDLFPVPQVVDEFDADNPFALEDVVVAETALTLDGKIADAHGAARWITGDLARADAHRLRSEADAIRLRPHPYEFALYYDI